MTSNQRNIIYLVIFWVLICLNHFSNAEIVVRPSNTEALVGSSTFFNCSTSSLTEEIHWFYYAVGSTTDRTLIYGYDQFYPPFQERFHIEKYGGLGNSYNLIITSVAAQDAGRYECKTNVGHGVKTYGELIVIGANPACTSNTETNEVIGPNSCGLAPTNLVLTCTVNYTGNEAPIMEIGPAGGSAIADERVSRQVYDNRVTYKLTLKGDASLDGVSYKCQTRRSATNPHFCSYGPFTVPDNTSTFKEPEKNSCGAAIAFIVILILIIIAGIVVAVLYLRKPSVFKIFNRQDGKKDLENPNAREEGAVDSASALLEKSEVLEIEEPVVMPEMSAKLTQDENEHYEKLRKRLSQSLNTIGQKEKEIDDLKKKNEQLMKINKQLEDEKHELEGRLYPTAITGDYVKPTLVATIEMTDLKPGSKKEKTPIFGMTILHNKLCIITENSSQVAVYDSVTFKSEASWHIDDMSNPQDITSCSINDCLYICDGEPKKEKFILRVASNKTVLNNWTIEPDEGRLSVTREANVAVSLFNGNKINEYTPNGDLIRTVRLSPADNISHPWHAIKTTSMHFIFSHGTGIDQLQRVCVADVDGKIKKYFGGKKGPDIREQHMNRPVHLLEDSSRNVLVADMKNKRVFLLSPTLELKRILVPTDKCNLKFPMRLCLDEEKGILFVADNNYKKRFDKEVVDTYDSGRVLIFNCKKK